MKVKEARCSTHAHTTQVKLTDLPLDIFRIRQVECGPGHPATHGFDLPQNLFVAGRPFVSAPARRDGAFRTTAAPVRAEHMRLNRTLVVWFGQTSGRTSLNPGEPSNV